MGKLQSKPMYGGQFQKAGSDQDIMLENTALQFWEDGVLDKNSCCSLNNYNVGPEDLSLVFNNSGAVDHNTLKGIGKVSNILRTEEASSNRPVEVVLMKDPLLKCREEAAAKANSQSSNEHKPLNTDTSDVGPAQANNGKEVACRIDLSAGEKEGWSYTLYNLEGRNNTVREDLLNVMQALCDKVTTQASASDGGKDRSKFLKIQLTVTPSSNSPGAASVSDKGDNSQSEITSKTMSTSVDQLTSTKSVADSTTAIVSDVADKKQDNCANRLGALTVSNDLTQSSKVKADCDSPLDIDSEEECCSNVATAGRIHCSAQRCTDPSDNRQSFKKWGSRRLSLQPSHVSGYHHDRKVEPIITTQQESEWEEWDVQRFDRRKLARLIEKNMQRHLQTQQANNNSSQRQLRHHNLRRHNSDNRRNTTCGDWAASQAKSNTRDHSGTPKAASHVGCDVDNRHRLSAHDDYLPLPSAAVDPLTQSSHTPLRRSSSQPAQKNRRRKPKPRSSDQNNGSQPTTTVRVDRIRPQSLRVSKRCSCNYEETLGAHSEGAVLDCSGLPVDCKEISPLRNSVCINYTEAARLGKDSFEEHPMHTQPIPRGRVCMPGDPNVELSCAGGRVSPNIIKPKRQQQQERVQSWINDNGVLLANMRHTRHHRKNVTTGVPVETVDTRYRAPVKPNKKGRKGVTTATGLNLGKEAVIVHKHHHVHEHHHHYHYEPTS